MRSPSRALLPGPRHSCAPAEIAEGTVRCGSDQSAATAPRGRSRTPAGTPSAATCSCADSNRAPSHIACGPRAMRYLYAAHGRSPRSATRPHPGAHAHPPGIWRLRLDPREQLPARGGLRTGRARVFGARSSGRSRRTLRRHGIDLLPGAVHPVGHACLLHGRQRPARSLETRGRQPPAHRGCPALVRRRAAAISPEPAPKCMVPRIPFSGGAPDCTHPDVCAPKCT